MNGEFRRRVLSPASIPIVALLFIGALTWSISRVLLAVERDAAVVVAILVAGEVLAIAAIVAARPRIRPSVLSAVLVLAFGAVVGSGIVAERAVGELPIPEEVDHAKSPPPKPASGPGGGARPAVVFVDDNFFEPKEVTVAAGATITWEGKGTQPHNVVADDDSFDSHADCKTFADAAKCMKQGDTFEFTFEEPGRYPYYCRIHGAAGGQGMAGVVVVSEGRAAPGGAESPQASAPEGSPEAPPAAAVEPVDVQDNVFAPQEITVKAGTKVTWEQTGTQPHTVTADDDSFDSHSECRSFADAARCMKAGDTFEFTFENPGRYPYYCRIHGGPGGAGMAGVVIVE